MKSVNNWTSWLLLIFGLLVTIVATLYVKSKIDDKDNAEFRFACNTIADKIDVRLQAHAQLLRSNAAFLTESEHINNEQWNNYINQQNLERNLPGVLSIGYALKIPKNQLEEHVQN